MAENQTLDASSVADDGCSSHVIPAIACRGQTTLDDVRWPERGYFRLKGGCGPGVQYCTSAMHNASATNLCAAAQVIFGVVLGEHLVDQSVARARNDVDPATVVGGLAGLGIGSTEPAANTPQAVPVTK
jgi:hypothetical protein